MDFIIGSLLFYGGIFVLLPFAILWLACIGAVIMGVEWIFKKR